MNGSTMTLDQIRRAGLDALARELGPVGLVRFLQHSEIGAGDYTESRRKWLDSSDVGTLSAQIRQRRHAEPGGRLLDGID